MTQFSKSPSPHTCRWETLGHDLERGKEAIILPEAIVAKDVGCREIHSGFLMSLWDPPISLLQTVAVCGSFWELLENCRSFEKAFRTRTLVLWLSAVISRGSFSDFQSLRVGSSIHRCSFLIESWLDFSFSVLSFWIPSYPFLLDIVFIRVLLRNRWGRQSENLYLLISGT